MTKNMNCTESCKRTQQGTVLYDRGWGRGDMKVSLNSNSEVAEPVNPQIPTATKTIGWCWLLKGIPNQEEPGYRVTPPSGSQ